MVVTLGVTILLDAVHGTAPTPLSIAQLVAPAISVHDSVVVPPGAIVVGVAVSVTLDGAVWLPHPLQMKARKSIASVVIDGRDIPGHEYARGAAAVSCRLSRAMPIESRYSPRVLSVSNRTITHEHAH